MPQRDDAGPLAPGTTRTGLPRDAHGNPAQDRRRLATPAATHEHSDPPDTTDGPRNPVPRPRYTFSSGVVCWSQVTADMLGAATGRPRKHIGVDLHDEQRLGRGVADAVPGQLLEPRRGDPLRP